MTPGNDLSFIGRKEELADLERFTHKTSASLIIIKGRRRIGKSRLIEEFAKKKSFYSFAGLAPTEDTTAQSQRDEFSRQLSEQAELPEITANDWSKLFSLLAERIKKGNVIILFDEISWMGSEDSNFLGKIKHCWDTQLKKNPKLILIICGSASSWIEKNILSSTQFLGRVSYTMTLRELTLQDCNKFWGKYSDNISAYEKFKILSITGGIPKYLEEINPKLSAEENIKNLCFKPGGLLVDEFDRIFSDIFLRESHFYKQIVSILANGIKESTEISKMLNLESHSGRVTEYLQELALAGFVTRDYTWHITTGEDSKLSRYRLSDNYLRFYLMYIEKSRTKIERNGFVLKTLTALPEWNSVMKLQFESLVVNNRKEIYTLLGLRAEDIISENPFFQKATTKQKGCQIDYMIQTKFSTLYICEIKFSKNIIGVDVVEEVKKKIAALKRPKGVSVRAVLIHVNGVSNDLVDSEFFSAIIDFSQFLGT